MASKFYFFTDTDLLSAQVTGDAFGPAGIDGAGNDSYRLTSMHSAAAVDPSAYAVCSGIVCVQEIPGTSPALVNLILKPLDQPPLNFAPVKYIIYKGIKAASLIDPNGTDVAASATNQLTKLAWEVQAKKNASAGTPNATA